MNHNTSIHTEYGDISGIRRNGCRLYLGIPFAKPPVDDLAFRHPVRPDAWSGVLSCTKGRANPIQSPGSFSTRYNSQDCLYLNIFVPENGDGPRPVMVWIYGGSYNSGGTGAFSENSDQINYDLSYFAKETDTIVVTFNYRLNLYGFLNLRFLSDRYESNCGLFDQIMALQFVHDNIASFGGDPDNVTVFGQSAGGACILALMVMDAAKGLFQKSIVHSACIEHFFNKEESEKAARIYLRTAKISAKHPEKLLDLQPEKVESINSRFTSRILKRGELRCAFSPVIDGITLKEVPKTAMSDCSMPLLIGCTRQEANLYIMPIPQLVTHFIAPVIGMKVLPGDKPFRERLSDAVTEHVYQRPMGEILSSYQGPAWRYEYTHVTPDAKESGLGSFHASDLPVLFGKSMPFENIDDPDSRRAGEYMRSIWSRFAWKGDPGWPRWAEKPVAHLLP